MRSPHPKIAIGIRLLGDLPTQPASHMTRFTTVSTYTKVFGYPAWVARAQGLCEGFAGVSILAARSTVGAWVVSAVALVTVGAEFLTHAASHGAMLGGAALLEAAVLFWRLSDLGAPIWFGLVAFAGGLGAAVMLRGVLRLPLRLRVYPSSTPRYADAPHSL